MISSYAASGKALHYSWPKAKSQAGMRCEESICCYEALPQLMEIGSRPAAGLSAKGKSESLSS